MLFAIALALAFGLLLAPVAMQMCRFAGWLDVPGHHKRHRGEVPLAGGMLIAAAAALAGLVVDPGLRQTTHFWLGAVMVFAVGFADDRFPIRARYRFAAQLSAALLFVVLSGVTPTDLGRLFGPFVVPLGMLGLPFAMIGIAGLTNAFNMIDGLDGLAGGLVLISLSWLLIAFALIAGDVASSSHLVASAHQASLVTAVVTGALIAFLLFNQRAPWRGRASMFLGDGGSMLLGYLVATLGLYASSAFGQYGMTPVTAAWIAAVPLTDLFSSMLRRALAGETPMTPDRKHVHHLMLALGLGESGAVVVLQVTALLTGLIGIAGWRLGVPEYWMFWGLIALFVVYVTVARQVWRTVDPEPAR